MIPPAHLMPVKASVNLLRWYRANQRPLPWRENRDPYRIWISEIMLQQTTVEAVIPYYEKFLTLFPTLEHLARAPLERVLEAWAGLGYYSRARNLHAAAKRLHELGHFPQTYEELLKLPGFGPYTARAVSSIAFDEPVGVLDGNVIRVLSRFYGQAWQWWKQAERAQLQQRADQLAQQGPSHEINQALMELGATLCLPRNPQCLLCPWLEQCQGRLQGRVEKLPLPKPRRTMEYWQWRPEIYFDRTGTKVFLCANTTGPVLRGQPLPPGEFRRLNAKPKSFDLRHNVTHHDFFIHVRLAKKSELSKLMISKGQWVDVAKVRQVSPFSMVKKVLNYALAKKHHNTSQPRPAARTRAARVSR